MLIAFAKLSPPGIMISSPIEIFAIEINNVSSKKRFPVTEIPATLYFLGTFWLNRFTKSTSTEVIVVSVFFSWAYENNDTKAIPIVSTKILYILGIRISFYLELNLHYSFFSSFIWLKKGKLKAFMKTLC